MKRKLTPDNVFNKKLAAYSAMAGAVFAIPHTSDAAIEYKDLDPDVSVGLGSTFLLDLNNDGTDDFRFTFDRVTYSTPTSQYPYPVQWDNVQVRHLSPGNLIKGVDNPPPPPFASVPYMNLNDPISSGLNWIAPGGTKDLYMGGFWNFVSGPQSTSGDIIYGLWSGVTDKYIGLRIQIGNDTHYGWARLDIGTDYSSLVIKDYAYESIPATTIFAGATPTTADGVGNIVGNDIGDAGDGSDLQVTFDKGADESTIDHYRVMVVKSAVAPTFNLTTAQALSPAQYDSVAKTGSNITYTVRDTLRDSDGDFVGNGVAYKIFVQSVSDGFNSNVDTLVGSAGDITLTTIIPTDPVSNIQVSDTADNQNGNDLLVTFDKIADESKASVYRVIAVKTPDAATFTIGDAQGLPTPNYVELAKTGSNLSTSMGSGGLDKDGDAIIENQPYTIFVLTVADGVNANQDALSTGSADITLTSPPPPTITVDSVTNVVGADVSDNYNASDIQVSFDMIANEDELDEYRVMVVKTANAGAFDLTAAEAVTAGNYTEVNKTGSNISITLDAGAKDVDGDSIATEALYKVFVMSVADGVNATLNNLSDPSAEFSINKEDTVGPGGIAEAEWLNQRVDIYSNGSNIYVNLDQSLRPDGQIKVYNMLGQELQRAGITNHRMQVNMAGRPDDIFIVRVEINNAVTSRKVFVNR